MSEQITATAISAQTDRPWLFKPGQSGNPRGRPKVEHDIVEMLSPHVPTAVKAIVRCLDDPKHSLRAAEILLDRVYGKPVQAISSPDAATTVTFLHLIAARAFSEQLQAGNVPVIEGATEQVADATKAPPDLMEPAKE